MRLAWFSAENKRISKKNESLSAENAAYKARLSSSNASYDEIELAHARLVESNTELQSSWDFLKSDRDSLLDGNSVITGNRDSLLRDINITRGTLQEEQNKNSDLRSAAFKLQTDLDMRVNAIVILEDQIQFLSKVNALNHAAVKAAIATTAGTTDVKSPGDAEPSSSSGRFYSQQ